MSTADLGRAGLASYRAAVAPVEPSERVGRVSRLVGLIAAVRGLRADMGELCRVRTADGADVTAEVVGFQASETLIMPLGDLRGIGPGTAVHATGAPFRLRVSDDMLGRVLDGLGRPIDDLDVPSGAWRDTTAPAPSPLERRRITERLQTGVRAIDTLIPCGRGQRLGIFAGSGVGKSSLLGMIARCSDADVNVICLVGERGREVQDFIEHSLGAEGLARSVVIAATSDQPALVRIKAALVATAVAEHFRDAGRQVMLMMDSVTRLAMAQREVGLAAGEPPATRGYPPSVWALLPQVLERAGATADGAITALYTVLVDGDDPNEPISDTVRSILDGHVMLSRALAHRNHYPAIDVLQSISRLQNELLTGEVQQAAGALRKCMATHRDKEDLITIGAYPPGTDPAVDYAIAKKPQIDEFLRQSMNEHTVAQDADLQLTELMADEPDLAAPVAAGAGASVGPADPAIPNLHLPS